MIFAAISCDGHRVFKKKQLTQHETVTSVLFERLQRNLGPYQFLNLLAILFTYTYCFCLFLRQKSYLTKIC